MHHDPSDLGSLIPADPDHPKGTYLKFLLWPVTTDTNNTMSQSEHEANTCNRRQARENACEQVTSGFYFLCGTVKQSPSKRELLYLPFKVFSLNNSKFNARPSLRVKICLYLKKLFIKDMILIICFSILATMYFIANFNSMALPLRKS